MRRINPKDFTLAKRGTSREINRQIALTLIRAHQPVSRADLARLMDTNRGNVTFLINELLEENLVREGARGNEKIRGRKPTFLYLNSQSGFAIALDVRASRTFMMVTDSIGKQIGDIVSFPTEINPRYFVRELGRRVRAHLSSKLEMAACEGIGIVIPGMLDRESGFVMNAPTLGWRDVKLHAALKSEFEGIEIHVEIPVKLVRFRRYGRRAAMVPD